VTKKTNLKPWRKLYRHEPPDFKGLSVYVRGLAAELLKYAEEDGRLVPDDGKMALRLAQSIGASVGDRRTLGRDINVLLADGYLVRSDGWLRIRNMVTFQSGAAEESSRESNANAPRVQRERPASPTRTPRESNARSELSAGNNSGAVPTTERHLSDIESRKREESEPPSPQTGGVVSSTSGQTTSTPNQPPAPEPSSPEQNPAVLRRAYSDGVSSATATAYVFPRDDREFQAFAEAMAHHCAGKSEAESVVWVRGMAERYAKAKQGRAGYERGYAPRKFVEWLNSGMESAPAASRPAQPAQTEDFSAPFSGPPRYLDGPPPPPPSPAVLAKFKEALEGAGEGRVNRSVRRNP
jgi:hypothetical protein